MYINKVCSYVEDSKATVIIVHGILEHLGRYNHVKDYLNDKGYNVVRYDQRGHGKSSGKKGSLKSFHNLIDDLNNIVLEEKSKSDNKIFLLGHSMGGLVVNLYQAKYGDVEGVISIGAATNTPKDAKALKYTGFWYLRWLKISGKRMDEHLSRDKEVLKKNKNDPLLLTHMYVSLVGEMFIKGVKYLHENINNLTAPILYLHGGSDNIVSPKFSEYMFKNIPSKDKSIKIYEGAYHEILNEINKEEVLSDIDKWLKSKI